MRTQIQICIIRLRYVVLKTHRLAVDKKDNIADNFGNYLKTTIILVKLDLHNSFSLVNPAGDSLHYSIFETNNQVSSQIYHVVHLLWLESSVSDDSVLDEGSLAAHQVQHRNLTTDRKIIKVIKQFLEAAFKRNELSFVRVTMRNYFAYFYITNEFELVRVTNPELFGTAQF